MSCSRCRHRSPRLPSTTRQTVYAILLRTAAETLRIIAADPKHLGAEIGLLAVLHTWGQNLHHHPHVHCVVPGGGPSLDGTRWVACRPGFFLPVRVLARLFRRLFLDELRAAFEAGDLGFFGELAGLAEPAAFARRLRAVRQVDWVVYAKPPFGGPAQVLAYLGRYTHRVAIANSRLISLTGTDVTFRWKDYRHHGKAKLMTLSADEFIRRFLMHTLPDGFHRIRHYGFLANGHRAAKLALCRRLLDAPPPGTARQTGPGYRPATPPPSAARAAAAPWSSSPSCRARHPVDRRSGTTARDTLADPTAPLSPAPGAERARTDRCVRRSRPEPAPHCE